MGQPINGDDQSWLSVKLLCRGVLPLKLRLLGHDCNWSRIGLANGPELVAACPERRSTPGNWSESSRMARSFGLGTIARIGPELV